MNDSTVNIPSEPADTVARTDHQKELASNGQAPRMDVLKASATRFLLPLTCVLWFFFISGAAGLLYQVVWTRMLTLLFGTTAHAVGTVLTIFFLGLGAGSLMGGRLADQSRHPLRLYGLFEIGIGVWALAFLLLLPLFEPVVPAILRRFDFSHASGIALRALLSFTLLCIPVLFMGATMPLLSRFAARRNSALGGRLGALYTVNTCGAVAGCMAAGFLLIPSFGYLHTTLIGVALNLFAGAGALAVSVFHEPVAEENAAPPLEMLPSSPNADPTAGDRARLLLLAAMVCGFSGLALEVIWTRLLAIVFLGTTYAYTTLLTTFLCGIAAGSACASLIADRLHRRQAAVGIAMGLIAVLAIRMLGWTATLPARFLDMHRAAGGDWTATTRGTFLLSFLTLFPLTFFFGMAFPLVLRGYAASGAHLGRGVGRVYATNTLGAVAGSVAGGFLLLPVLGAHNGIIAISLLLLGASMTLLLACRNTGTVGKGVAAATILLLYVLAWHYAPADVSQSLNVGYIPSDHRVLFFKEGVEGTVVVSEPETAVAGEDRVLWINRVQATTSIERGVKMNRLQGVLPLLFERDCREVLFMCFGSGITCGTLALHDFDAIDAVEISPEVLEAAPFFEKDNLGVLHHPKVRFHVDDGRNYLLRTSKRYDLITFEPMPLALAGVSTFYTREYYALCLGRLAPGGLVSQWIPLHSNDPEVVRALAHTFTSVFPEYCAYFVNADLFLIGSDRPLHMHYERARERLSAPPLHEALAASGLGDVIEVMSCFLMDKTALDHFVQDAAIMTDNHPWAEFVAPRLVYARKVPEALDALLAHAVNPVARVLPDSMPDSVREALNRRAQSRLQDMNALKIYYGGSMLDDTAARAFVKSLTIDPLNLTAQYYLKEIVRAQSTRFMRWGEYDRVRHLTELALQVMPNDDEFLSLHAQASPQ